MHTYFLQFYLIYIVQASINRKSSWAMFRKCAISKEKNGIFVFFKRDSTWKKKRKPWKINSSWRDCLFSFLFEFLPHCVWLKMIMKCKLFEILTRHLFQKKRNTLYSFWKSFCQWTENADCLQGERDYFPSSHDLNWMFSIVSKWILILSNFRIINKK